MVIKIVGKNQKSYVGEVLAFSDIIVTILDKFKKNNEIAILMPFVKTLKEEI